MKPTNGGEAHERAWRCGRSVPALVPQSNSLLELLRIERPPLAAANSRRPPVPATRRSNLESHL